MNIQNQWGFPVFVNDVTLSKDLEEKADNIAATLVPPKLLILTGSGGIGKERFALELVSRFYKRAQCKKRPKYIYAPSIESIRPIPGEEYEPVHYVVFGSADQIDARYSRAVLARVFDVIANGNLAIMIVRSLESLYAKYGQDFVQSYASVIRVIDLGGSKEIVLQGI